MYAAMLDEMSFFIKQFKYALIECPNSAPEGSSDVKLMEDYAAKLDAKLLKINQKELGRSVILNDRSFILKAGFKRADTLSKYQDDQMFRAFFASKIATDGRLTAGMTRDEIADVSNTFATTSLRY
ncbi:hypothetical protein DID99_36435 [Burkholderia sp. Bp8986]|nr:hypothetical protein DID99_36435 [Burkholderia sp. Bp8986]